MPDFVERYRRHYGVPDAVELSLDHLRHHLIVELEVTRDLLESEPEQRHHAFAEGYARIYRELWWFNVADDAADPGAVDIDGWRAMIGPPPRRVYEVGSGQGTLARALAQAGYDVVATDISSERGGARTGEPGMTWGETDGVHLDRFAEPGTFDAVISDQMVEHLHPDDFLPHLRSARALLKPGGKYAFRTPHGPSGPYDSSLPFGFPLALATHLREYCFSSRVALLRSAGYREVLAERPSREGPVPSAAYVRYLTFAEQQLDRLPLRLRRLVVKRLLRDRIAFRRNAILAATA
ncbi:MAG: class I SAM-dependent methyltransferase [Solirubrobacteraceae bacterium]|nr:class I SAM-dependent methyltransferase [Solirubrobacteraceae bacterium]